MNDDTRTPPRRDFVARLGGAGAALALGACAPRALPSAPRAVRGAWDVSWIDRVKRATHRAVFDGPQGDVALMLAARYLDNVEAVYGRSAPDVVAVINLRTRAVPLGLSDATWAKYPIGEDANVKDTASGAPARRNLNYLAEAGANAAVAGMTLERLHQRGAIVLICDFALGHLATRLAAKVSATSEAVHAELRAGLVPGAVLLPSGIFGLGEAQNAGCAFVPG